MKKFLLTFCFLLTGVCAVDAEIHLPALISDHMVLQQQAEVKLWGNSNAGKQVRIKISWNQNVIITKADKNGRWSGTVKTPLAGGPYTITFSDGKEKTISDVMIGEVWLCSGQSNMEMPMKGYQGQPVYDAQNTIVKAKPDIPVRLFRVERNKSVMPLQNVEGVWNTNHSQAVKEFSAVAYFFADYIQSVLNVPVGIISTSWGGSPIEAWMDSTTLAHYIKVNTGVTTSELSAPPRHCELFNAMLYPLMNYRIKGMLWYQGEANVYNPELYARLLPAMVGYWRDCCKYGFFPFYYAQIAPWKYNGVNNKESARFREMQQQLTKIIPVSGMIVTADTGDSIVIHSPQKKLIAERFAYLALNETYGRKGIEYMAPQFKSMEIQNDTIVLSFGYVNEGFHSIEKQIKGFEVAGEDRIFRPARGMFIDKSRKIQLTNPLISKPVAVRYAFRNYSCMYIYNNFGFPLIPFRTDHWTE